MCCAEGFANTAFEGQESKDRTVRKEFEEFSCFICFWAFIGQLIAVSCSGCRAGAGEQPSSPCFGVLRVLQEIVAVPAGRSQREAQQRRMGGGRQGESRELPRSLAAQLVPRPGVLCLPTATIFVQKLKQALSGGEIKASCFRCVSEQGRRRGRTRTAHVGARQPPLASLGPSAADPHWCCEGSSARRGADTWVRSRCMLRTAPSLYATALCSD